MSAKSKVYVIDESDASALKSQLGKRGTERTEYSPDEAQGASGRRRRGESARLDERGSPHMTLLSYLAGPFAVLTTCRGRDSRFWVSVAIASMLMAAGVAIAHQYEYFAASHGGSVGYLLWLSCAILAALMGFAAWMRGVYLLGHHKGWLLKKLPSWLTHPGFAGVFGLVIPGFGLYVTNHSKRAVAVLIAVCAAAVSAIVLWQAPDLWRLSQASVPHAGFLGGLTAWLLAGHGDFLERMFLAMGAIVCFGALAWIVQALDGARLAGNRGEERAHPRGDLAAVALVLALVAFLATFKPARVAETIDHFAVAARLEGMRIIPLCGAQTAMRLDPSRPEYVMQAIEMNEALGRPVEALALLRDLTERWKPFDRMLRVEAAAAEKNVLGSETP